MTGAISLLRPLTKGPKDPRVFLSAYRPYAFRVNWVKLFFDVRSTSEVVVRSQIEFEAAHPCLYQPFLELNGSAKLKINSVCIDDQPVAFAFSEEDELLHVADPPTRRPFVFSAEVVIDPAANTACSGLYKSGKILLTQCEAEGFRNITFFPDRPDVLAVYEVTIEASEADYPVMLANGNQTESVALAEGRRRVSYKDPFPKASYLFCVVLGNLRAREAWFECGLHRTGERVRVAVWTKPEDWTKSAFALECVLKAIRWDEEEFGRVYDLDEYHLVGVDDFVFGAMENKGLNVFSSSYILADSQTTHDARFADVDATIAHEYFHNYSGNRVTLLSFFEISLKEGATTFREQQYCKAMHGRAQATLAHARYMQSAQFLEDSGQMAAPIIPPCYEAIDNFYTATVYQKGAEVVRMLCRLLGAEHARKGFDLFFARHDGQAVTVHDFVKAMGDGAAHNGGCPPVDLSSFLLWYYQAGTPVVSVQHEFPAQSLSNTLRLTLSQRIPSTAGDTEQQQISGKLPMPIPVAVALFDAQGNQVTASRVSVADDRDYLTGEISDPLLLLNEQSMVFEFSGLSAPVHAISVLRDFSAPVLIEYPQQELSDLLFLLKHETDAFARFQAAKAAIERALRKATEKGSTEISFPAEFHEAIAALIEDAATDAGLKAEILSAVPEPSELANLLGKGQYSPLFLHELVRRANREIATGNLDKLRAAYENEVANSPEKYEFTVEHVSRRLFKNACLHLLVECGHLDLGVTAFREARNFTDRLEAVYALNDQQDERREAVLAAFLDKYREDTLVLRSYCRVVARSNVSGNRERVGNLMLDQSVYNELNPECIRAVLCGFASSPVNFHEISGAGYRFVAEGARKVNAVNPTVAAQVLDAAFSDWRLWDAATQARIRPVLQDLLDNDKTLEKQVQEVLKRALADS